MLDTQNTAPPEKQSWKLPLILLIGIAVFAWVGVRVYSWYSIQQTVAEAGLGKGVLESEKEFYDRCVGDGALKSDFSSMTQFVEARLRMNSADTSVNQNQPKTLSFASLEDSERYYGYSCLDEYIGQKLFRDMFPGGIKLEDQSDKDDYIEQYVDYCRTLPEGFVHPNILSDQAFVSDLSYTHLCMYIVSSHLSAPGNQRFTLSLNEFVENYPQWKSPERDDNGLLSGYNLNRDLSKYLCQKAYGAEQSVDRTKCEKPRTDKFYEMREKQKH